MAFTQEMNDVIQTRHMLSHPFYQDWMAGKLTLEQLGNYATQYTPFVDAFPRFVSATHSLCKDQKARKVLLENLNDEEGGVRSAPHPELWRDFAAGLGAASADGDVGPKAQALEQTFFSLCRSSYAEGLGALYAYESQIPEISAAKITGLAERYGITDAKTVSFFAVHREADVYHSQACAELLEQLSDEQRTAALGAARKAGEALWDFLSEAHVS